MGARALCARECVRDSGIGGVCEGVSDVGSGWDLRLCGGEGAWWGRGTACWWWWGGVGVRR